MRGCVIHLKFKVALVVATVTAYLLVSLTLHAQHTKLWDFNGTNGSEPWGSLISDGTFLYGMTIAGGTNNQGTIFKILKDGSGYVKLLDFSSAVNGSFPFGSLIYDGTHLYGVTEQGGVNNLGTIFKIKTDGTGYVKLLDFAGTANGQQPNGSLIFDGTFLYGMTLKGGINDMGTVFKILTDGSGYAKLLDFAGSINGAFPFGSLVRDGSSLYGMTNTGGTNDQGVVFTIKTDGTGYVRLLNFTSATTGKWPFGSLLFDGTFLYGMTSSGGTSNDGTIFKIRPDGTGYVRMFNFNLTIGDEPSGDLISDGTFLYGMTYSGGSAGTGNLFKIKPDGTGYEALHDFATSAEGWLPNGSLLLEGSFLYGMTQQGGAGDHGTVFSYQLPFTPPTIISFTPTSGDVGTTVTITGTNFNSTTTNNIVYFGATRATVTEATATQLTVIVPAGATYQPISVLVNGLTAFSSKPFNVTLCSAPGITSGSFATPINFGTGNASGPVSISVGDLDGDGKADLIVANRFANTVSVFRNTSSAPGSVSYAPKIDLATGFEPVSITVGDLDGDGKGDLAVAVFGSATISVFRNTSSGPGTISFAPKLDFPTGPLGAGPFSVALSDVDKDGKVDMAVANSLSNQASVLLNTSSGPGSMSFAARVDFPTGAGAGPYSIFVGDIDSDGKDDLVTSNANNNSVSVFRNTSSGAGNISYAARINFSTGTTPRSVSIGDLDGDSKPDLAVTSEIPDIVSIFRNTSSAGSISFAGRQDFATDIDPWLVALGDLDGDQKVDLATANGISANISLLHNTSTIGSISFSSKVDFSAGSGFGLVAVSIGDFDNDGKSDLVAAEFNGDAVSVLRNTIPTTTPTIASFAPTAGIVGTSVTINGTNFSTTRANNTVHFNGTLAVVTASTATSLITNVPPGATTGKISVAVGCGTIVSADDFTVSSTTNQPPIITATTTGVPIEGIITLDLEPLISDPDDNLDPNSLYLVNSVSEQGASASLNNAFILTLDYGGVQFFGTDRIDVGVCDLVGECVEQELAIEVGGDIIVFNALSPNGDGKNEIFVIQYIDILPETQSNKVTIVNRWGDVVFDVSNYNNNDRVFKGVNNGGKDLPSGIYYYKIEFSGKTKTGYLSLKR